MTHLERNKQAHRDIFDGTLNRPLLVAQEGWGSIQRVGDYVTTDRPIHEFVPPIVERYQKWLAMSEATQDDSVPFPSLMTGTHVYAACFGATPHFYSDPTTPPFVHALVHSAAEADRVPEQPLANSRPLLRVFELAAALQRELGTDVTLGCPDMQTGFDTACILWDKTDFLCSMVEAPDAVKRLAGKCERLLFEFVETYRREFPNTTFGHCPQTWTPPDRGPWVSNDECGIMSREMFEEFCLPELIRMSEKFGSLGMHSCAHAQHQFESFKKIPNFYAFDRGIVNMTWESDNALAVLGGPTGPVFVTAADNRTLLRLAPEGTRFIFNLFSDSVEDAKRNIEAARKC